MYNDQSQTYSDFKNEFYSRFPDLSVFNLDEEVNLLKVVLSGFRVNYAARGAMIRRFIFFPRWKRELFLQVKKIRSVEEKNLSYKKEILFLVSDRFVKKEGVASKVEVYSGEIQEIVGRDRSLIVSNCSEDKKVDQDVSYQSLKRAFFSRTLSEEENKLLKSVKKWYQKFRAKFQLSTEEAYNIEVALQDFFIDYCSTRRLIEANQTNFQKCYLVCHYHNEGKIWALREAGVEIVEMQHGLISETDIFYCFPENIKDYRNRMLFPDKILVWGEYWQEVLSKGFEFDRSQIINTGFFPVQEKSMPDDELLSFLKEDKLKVVVCTQVSLHKYFIEYINWLANEDDQIQIVVKPHPSESFEVYNELRKYNNVLLTSCNINAIFPLVDIHISIYSTTLIESMKYQLKNYSLDVEICSDYVDEYVREGISERISVGQKPEVVHHKSVSTTRFFNTFDKNLLLSH